MTAQEQEYCTIPLTQNQITKVNKENYALLSRWNWYAKWDSTTKSYYAVRNSDCLPNGNQRPVSMARQIMSLEFGDKRQVDHRNHDTLDNRHINLRIVTPSQNAINRNQKIARSGTRGVCFRYGKWEARIGFNGQKIVLGRFCTKEEAVRARVEAEVKYHGEYIPCTDF